MNKNLTKRDIEVIKILATGLSNAEIAKKLKLSVSNIKHRIAKSCWVCDIHPVNRVTLVYYWSCPLFVEGLRELGLIKKYNSEEM